MKTESNLKIVTWLGFGMGLGFVILGTISFPSGIQPIPTFTLASPTSPILTDIVPTVTPEPSPTSLAPIHIPTPAIVTDTIPLEELVVAQPLTETVSQVWQFSTIEGDLEIGYPLREEKEHFTLHYQQNSLSAHDLDILLEIIATALGHIENTLDVHLDSRFDVYVAGSLFEPPDLALRGRSFSSQLYFFFLYDNSGSLVDQQYILTHELAHLSTWNNMGHPASVMLHEGVAVYTGMELIEDKGYIPLEMFCAAYQSVGRLPSVATSLSFEGHIRNLDNYYTAGGFVQFLIEKYGTDSFATVYHTDDYYDVYGKSLADLEAEWTAILRDSNHSISFNPHELVQYVDRVTTAYDRLFSNFDGTESQMSAYLELDQARMTLLQGRVDDTANHLLKFESILCRDLNSVQ